MPLLKPREDELSHARKRAGSKPSARIDFRPKPDQKKLFEHAAALEGQTLTEFLTRSAEERAEHIVAKHEAMELRGKASAFFVDLLTNPPEPNNRLRAAFKRHDEEVKSR